MKEKREDLPPELGQAILSEMTTQSNQLFQRIFETDWKLTQQNFLTNAGGAVAVLAFLGTGKAPEFMLISLFIFCLGIVFSGFEVRALLKYTSTCHSDRIEKRKQFVENKITVQESLLTQDIGKTHARINNVMGHFSQWSTILGLVLGSGYYVYEYINNC